METPGQCHGKVNRGPAKGAVILASNLIPTKLASGMTTTNSPKLPVIVKAIPVTKSTSTNIVPTVSTSTIIHKGIPVNTANIVKIPANTGVPKNFIKIVSKRTVQTANGNLIFQSPGNNKKLIQFQVKQGRPEAKSINLVPVTMKDAKLVTATNLTTLQMQKIQLSSGNKILAKIPMNSAVMPPPLVTLHGNQASILNSATNLPKLTAAAVAAAVAGVKKLEVNPLSIAPTKMLSPAQAATIPISTVSSRTLLTGSTFRPIKAIASQVSVSPILPLQELNTAVKNSNDEISIASTASLNSEKKIFNFQISNGKLSDPNGSIKILTSDERPSKTPSPAAEKTTTDAYEETFASPIEVSSSSTDSDASLKIDEKSSQDIQEVSGKNKVNKNSKESDSRSRLRSKSALLPENPFKISIRKRSTKSLDTNDALRASTDELLSELMKTKKKSSTGDSPLLCSERLNTSSGDSRATSSSRSVKSLGSSQSITSVETTPASSSVSTSLVSDRNQTEAVITFPKTEPEPVAEIDPFSVLKWDDGIGSLTASKMKFQFNDFGLIELIQNVETTTIRVDAVYEKPLYERDSKSTKTTDYSDPLYYCLQCKCHGAAVDFLEPEFCSHECVTKFHRRHANRKSANRKKQLANRVEDSSSSSSSLQPKKRRVEVKETTKFSWDTYIRACRGEPAPIHLFLNPFPCGMNLFQVGMKLEAIDPDHSSIFCVCSVVEKKGYRLKLHFDGYSKIYDFWINADSMDIFPPGWCAKTNRPLQPPKGYPSHSFNWPFYLNRTKSPMAPRNLFTHLNSSSNTNHFKVGMKLEADDLRNTGKVCVATVADVLDNRILVHFDGWDYSYDYWIDVTSPYIHPVNWHRQNGFTIVPPPDWPDRFWWKDYLEQNRAVAATADIFNTREPIHFKVGMKLEVVDKRNPFLIRPATVVTVDEYEIKVLFDGWSTDYAFWMEDDSPDIHPVGWCEITDHTIEPPPGFDNSGVAIPCKMLGCRGMGNAKHSDVNYHMDTSCCPYNLDNWTKEVEKPNRFHDTTVEISAEEMDFKRICLKRSHLPNAKAEADKPKYRKINILDGYRFEPQQSNSRKQQLEMKTFEETIELKPDGDISIPPEEELEAMNTPFLLDPGINISRHLLCDYGPRLQQAYALWKNNSGCLTRNNEELCKPIKKNPLEWTIDEVVCYVVKLPKCEEVGEIFSSEEIDGVAFLSLRQNDITDLLKIKMGPAIKIYNQIVQLREIVVTKFTEEPGNVEVD